MLLTAEDEQESVATHVNSKRLADTNSMAPQHHGEAAVHVKQLRSSVSCPSQPQSKLSLLATSYALLAWYLTSTSRNGIGTMLFVRSTTSYL